MATKFNIRVNSIRADWNSDGRRLLKPCVHCKKKKTKGRCISVALHKTKEPQPACVGCTIDAVFNKVTKR